MAKLSKIKLPNNVIYTLGNNADAIIVNNVTSSAFVSDPTYTDWPYRASLTVSGMTTEYVPDVYFDGTTTDIDKIAPFSNSYAGGVYIYASESISAVTAKTIKGIKAS